MDTLIAKLHHHLTEEIVANLTKIFSDKISLEWNELKSVRVSTMHNCILLCLIFSYRQLQGHFEVLKKYIPLASKLLTNSISLDFIERILGALNEETLIEIGNIRQLLLQTPIKESIETFEAALIAKLDIDNKPLKNRIEEYVFQYGKPIKTKNMWESLFDMSKKAMNECWNFIKSLF